MDVATMSRSYEPRVAKKVYLYRNGVTTNQAKMLVVNDRQVRDFATFLTRVTSGLKAPIAVRSIYTPVGGHRVRRLEDLESGKSYVAGGSEHFRKLKYGANTISPPRRPLRGNPYYSKATMAPTVIEAKPKINKLPDKPHVIHVFRNGDVLFRGVRILLHHRLLHSWEHVLEHITEKVELYTPAKKLCTLDGHVVHSVTDIVDGEKYVAVEGTRPFKKLPYCAIDPTLRNTRFKNRESLLKSKQQPLAQQKTAVTDEISPSNLRTSDSTIHTLIPRKPHKGKIRPFAGRKDKHSRNLAIIDAREDSIFGTSPTLQQARTLQLDTSTNQEGLLAKAASKLQDSARENEQESQQQTKGQEPSPSESAARTPASKQKHGTSPLAAQTPPSRQKVSITPSNQTPPSRRKSRATPQAKRKTPNQTPRASQSPALAGKDHDVTQPVEEELAAEEEGEVTEPRVPQPSSIVELQSMPLNKSVDLSLKRTEPGGTSDSIASPRDLERNSKEATPTPQGNHQNGRGGDDKATPTPTGDQQAAKSVTSIPDQSRKASQPQTPASQVATATNSQVKILTSTDNAQLSNPSKTSVQSTHSKPASQASNDRHSKKSRQSGAGSNLSTASQKSRPVQ